MKIGDPVFFYFKKELDKSNNISYRKILGKIIKTYRAGKFLTALEIGELFQIMPGDPKFRKFYIKNTSQKRIVIQEKTGEVYLLSEREWTINKHGDDTYVEKVLNSIVFIMDLENL